MLLVRAPVRNVWVDMSLLVVLRHGLSSHEHSDETGGLFEVFGKFSSHAAVLVCFRRFEVPST